MRTNDVRGEMEVDPESCRTSPRRRSTRWPARCRSRPTSLPPPSGPRSPTTCGAAGPGRGRTSETSARRLTAGLPREPRSLAAGRGIRRRLLARLVDLLGGHEDDPSCTARRRRRPPPAKLPTRWHGPACRRRRRRRCRQRQNRRTRSCRRRSGPPGRRRPAASCRHPREDPWRPARCRKPGRDTWPCPPPSNRDGQGREVR